MKRKTFESDLKKILADKSSGSADLLFSLNQFFIDYYKNIDGPIRIIDVLYKHFEAFQNIKRYLRELKQLTLAGHQQRKFFIETDQSLKISYQIIFENALPLLRNVSKIFTISNSRTVFEILKRLRFHNKHLSVIVAESRPKLEGRILAKKLAAQNISVMIVTEAMMAQYIPACDCALIGADAVLRNKDVVNKVGSLQLAIISKYYNKPLYVVAEKSKFSYNGGFKQHDENVVEIWKNLPNKIKTQNLYFEIVPNALITKCITD